MNRFQNRLAVAVVFTVVAMCMNSRQATAQSAQQSGPPGPGSAPVTIVNPLPLPVTGNVTVTGNVELAPGGGVNITNPATSPVPVHLGIAKRYNKQVFNASGVGDQVVPPVPAGQTFIATYFNVSGFSNASNVDLTDGFCQLRLQAGNTNSPFGAVPVRVNMGSLVASETAFLPINAGESLFVACFATPNNAAFWVVVGGHFVPAP